MNTIYIGPIRLAPPRIWKLTTKSRKKGITFWNEKRVGIFRNDGFIGGRWGFYILGLEIGNRDPNSTFGNWLKQHGLWPY